MLSRILKTNPVRLYSVVAAAGMLGAYYVPSGGWPLLVGLAATVLGVGQGVRSQVFSQATHERQMEHLMTITGAMPDPDDIPSTGSPDP